MTSRPRVYGRHGDGDAADDIRPSRELMQLILRDVVLREADARKRRVVIACSRAMLATLLSPTRESTKIYLSDLQRLGDGQLDRVLAGLRYAVRQRYARTAVQHVQRDADPRDHPSAILRTPQRGRGRRVKQLDDGRSARTRLR